MKKGEQKPLCFECAPQAVLPSHISAGVIREITVVPHNLENTPKILGHELALGWLVWNWEHWAKIQCKDPQAGLAGVSSGLGTAPVWACNVTPVRSHLAMARTGVTEGAVMEEGEGLPVPQG